MNTILELEHIQKYYGNEEMCIRDSTMIVPPCFSIISLDRKSPIPVPLFSMTALELPL